jgi:ABC-type multidrug transport system fused ATPase/permease subunit
MRPLPVQAESTSIPLDLGDSTENEKGPQGVKIELKNVWFKYPTRDVPVLNGLNMTVSIEMSEKLQKLTSHRSRKANLQPLLAHLVTIPSY